MLDHLLKFVDQIGLWAYVVVFAGPLLEASVFLGFVVPGETLALLGGLLASQHIIRLRYALILVCAGAIIGDTIGYELGRHFGRPWLLKHGRHVGVREHRLKKVETFFHCHGGKTVLIGRLTALLRALVPFVAGSSRMSYPRFVIYNAVGGIIWGVAVVLLGFYFGKSLPMLDRWIGRTGWIILGIVVAIGIGLWLWRKRRARRR